MVLALILTFGVDYKHRGDSASSEVSLHSTEELALSALKRHLIKDLTENSHLLDCTDELDCVEECDSDDGCDCDKRSKKIKKIEKITSIIKNADNDKIGKLHDKYCGGEYVPYRWTYEIVQLQVDADQHLNWNTYQEIQNFEKDESEEESRKLEESKKQAGFIYGYMLPDGQGSVLFGPGTKFGPEKQLGFVGDLQPGGQGSMLFGPGNPHFDTRVGRRLARFDPFGPPDVTGEPNFDELLPPKLDPMRKI